MSFDIQAFVVMIRQVVKASAVVHLDVVENLRTVEDGCGGVICGIMVMEELGFEEK